MSTSYPVDFLIGELTPNSRDDFVIRRFPFGNLLANTKSVSCREPRPATGSALVMQTVCFMRPLICHGFMIGHSLRRKSKGDDSTGKSELI
jgi:hypothetical protein